MVERIKIEVMGHRATICRVSARQADGISYKEDFLMVSIDLDDSVEGIAGFGVSLPVKRYDGDEFIAAVKEEAEKVLPKLIEKHVVERAKHQREKEKQESLDLVVEDIKSKVGLQ